MTQITISDGVTTITMPKVRKVSVGGKEVAKEVTMASGKMVKDVIGHRAVIAVNGTMFSGTMAALVNLLRAGGYFTVGTSDRTERTKAFQSTIKPRIFKFKSGVPCGTV